MKFISILFIFLVFQNQDSQDKTSIQEKYLNEVFKIIEKNSIRKDSVDFEEIKTIAYGKLELTKSIADCYPIVQSILKDLGDNHSFLMTKEKVELWENTSKYDKGNKLITFSGKTIDENVGYINMKGFSSGDKNSLIKYADSLQKLIKSIDNKNLKGWVLDLRENTGGNCWPMLAGIGPLLNNGICGYFINNRGKKSSWYYKNGESGINNNSIVSTSITPYKLINDSNPIAVLTGYKTASSGEVVVTAFHNKNNTKSFGGNTAGLSTGNTGFNLSDGSMIFLTTSVYADRNNIVFGNEIKPDVEIDFTYLAIGEPNDPVIKSAINWINGKYEH